MYLNMIFERYFRHCCLTVLLVVTHIYRWRWCWWQWWWWWWLWWTNSNLH